MGWELLCFGGVIKGFASVGGCDGRSDPNNAMYVILPDVYASTDMLVWLPSPDSVTAASQTSPFAGFCGANWQGVGRATRYEAPAVAVLCDRMDCMGSAGTMRCVLWESLVKGSQSAPSDCPDGCRWALFGQMRQTPYCRPVDCSPACGFFCRMARCAAPCWGSTVVSGCVACFGKLRSEEISTCHMPHVQPLTPSWLISTCAFDNPESR